MDYENKLYADLRKLIRSLYEVIIGSDEIHNGIIPIDIGRGEDLITRLKESIIKALLFIREVMNGLTMQGANIQCELLNNMYLYLKLMFDGLDNIIKEWMYYNSVFESVKDFSDDEDEKKEQLILWIRQMADIYVNILMKVQFRELGSITVFFVDGRQTDNRQIHMSKCLSSMYMPAPINSLCFPINLLGICKYEIANHLYILMSNVVSAITDVLDNHYSMIIDVLNYVEVESILKKVDPAMAVMISAGLEGLKNNGRIDSRMITLSIQNQSVLMQYTLLYPVLSGFIIRLPGLVGNMMTSLPPEIIDIIR